MVDAAPSGLSVEMLDEELAIFAWDVERGVPAGLTESEQDIFRHVVAGASNAEIAKARKTSARTVANQVAALLRKLDAESRYELIGRYGARTP